MFSFEFIPIMEYIFLILLQTLLYSFPNNAAIVGPLMFKRSKQMQYKSSSFNLGYLLVIVAVNSFK